MLLNCADASFLFSVRAVSEAWRHVPGFNDSWSHPSWTLPGHLGKSAQAQWFYDSRQHKNNLLTASESALCLYFSSQNDDRAEKSVIALMWSWLLIQWGPESGPWTPHLEDIWSAGNSSWPSQGSQRSQSGQNGSSVSPLLQQPFTFEPISHNNYSSWHSQQTLSNMSRHTYCLSLNNIILQQSFSLYLSHY